MCDVISNIWDLILVIVVISFVLFTAINAILRWYTAIYAIKMQYRKEKDANVQN